MTSITLTDIATELVITTLQALVMGLTGIAWKINVLINFNICALLPLILLQYIKHHPGAPFSKSPQALSLFPPLSSIETLVAPDQTSKGLTKEHTLVLSRASTLHNLLFYAHSLCLIDKTQTFSLAHCPIHAGMFLFCAGSTLKKVIKKIEQWVSEKEKGLKHDNFF